MCMNGMLLNGLDYSLTTLGCLRDSSRRNSHSPSTPLGVEKFFVRSELCMSRESSGRPAKHRAY